MTLVNNYQIEKVRTELQISIGFTVVIRKPLIKRKVDFVGFVDFFVFYNRKLVLEMFEVTCFGLRDQVLAVCKIKDALFHAALPQTVDNLESCICFAGSGRHDEQNPLLSAGNGFNRAVYRNTLIVARRVTVRSEEISRKRNLFTRSVGKPVVAFVTFPQSFRSRKKIQINLFRNDVVAVFAVLNDKTASV